MATLFHHAHGVHFGRADVQNVGMGLGIVLMLVGVLGFVPGVTTHYSELMFLGPASHAMLLGLFQVSMLLNIVHLAIGATGWAMSRTEPGARNFLLGAGALYTVLAVFGFIIGSDSAVNFLSLNMVDNWAHLALGIVMIVAGWLLARTVSADSA